MKRFVPGHLKGSPCTLEVSIANFRARQFQDKELIIKYIVPDDMESIDRTMSQQFLVGKVGETIKTSSKEPERMINNGMKTGLASGCHAVTLNLTGNCMRKLTAHG